MSPSKPFAERMRRLMRRSLWVPVEDRVLGSIRSRRNASKEWTPVFVTGAMGSGTTLVALSLGQRCDFACVVTESVREVASDCFLHVPRIEEFSSISSYLSALCPREEWSHERARRDLLALYRRHATGGSRFALDKAPNANLVRASLLARSFPDSHFVAVFRDPAANIEGFRRKWRTFAAESLDASVHFYRALYSSFLGALPTLGGRVTWVEYESFVEEPEKMLDSITRRVGLSPASARRRLPERGNHPGQGIRNVRGNRIGVVRDANESAYRNLEPAEIERIRTGLGPIHERMRALAEESRAS